MGLFSRLFGFTSRGLVLRLTKKLLYAIGGRLADDLEKVALEEVSKAEELGIPGSQKKIAVFKALRGRIQYKNLPEYLLHIAVESAVSLVDPKQF